MSIIEIEWRSRCDFHSWQNKILHFMKAGLEDSNFLKSVKTQIIVPEHYIDNTHTQYFMIF